MTDRRLRVLLVEDSGDDAALLLRELGKGGYEPAAERVDTAPALVAALARQEWDIVIADHVMPSFSGLAALEIVQRDPRDIPFIIVSGAIGEDQAVAAMKAGAHDYLIKDRLARLVPAVERELREAAARREHRRTEEALRASEARFRAFMGHIPAAAWIKDEQLRYAYANQSFARLLGRTSEEIIGNDDFALWPRDVAERLRANDQKAFATESTVETLEAVPNTAGELRSSVVLKFPLGDTGRRYVGGVAIDVTDRVRIEEALRVANQTLQALSGRMLEIQEAERRHLSHELHDEIGQALTAVKINLQSLFLRSDALRHVPQLEESVGIVDRALQQVRNLSLDLRPSQLDDLGLPAALRSHLDRQAKAAGIRAHFSMSRLASRLHPDLETVCFRIVQEALTNVARHAGARSVAVKLRIVGNELHLSVIDDGGGFDVGTARRAALHGKSLGLLGMEERVMLAGGRLDVNSAAGRGTRIRATFPLRYHVAG